MRRLLKEPLLYFVLLGVLLSAVHEWRGHRTPDEDEVRGIVEAHETDEILSHEALAPVIDRAKTSPIWYTSAN